MSGNKVWGTPILDEERGTLQQSPYNYIEGLEKRAYGVICTGIFPLEPDEVQIAKEALRKNNEEGLTDEYGIPKHLEACNVHADKVSADEVWCSFKRGGARVDIGHWMRLAERGRNEEAQRTTALEKRVKVLEEARDNHKEHILEALGRVSELEKEMRDDEDVVSVLTRLLAHKDDIARLEKRVKELEEQLDILELKSHTHSPKERDEGLRLSDKDQARWDSAMGYVSKTVKAVEEERPSEAVEDLGEVHLTTRGWIRVGRRRDKSLVRVRRGVEW